MPNHVTNIIKADPEVIASLVRERTAKERADHASYEEKRKQRFIERDGNANNFQTEELADKLIDFGLLIPIPDDDDPRITATKHDYGDGMVGWSFDGMSPMDFARDLWGTKWNAYSQVIDDRTDRIQFETAWSHPSPVILALSMKHPDAEIHVIYADEDFGNNLGAYTIKNGEYIRDNFPEPGSDEANEMAAMVLYEKSYEEVQAEWDADSIESARRSMFCKELEAERGIDNGYKVMHDEKLEIPEHIKQAIDSVVAAENYWNEE